MATYPERKAALEKNSTAKTIWMLILAWQVLSGLFAIAAIFGITALGSFAAAGLGSGALAGVVVVAGLLGLAVAALFFWGTWRMERWIVWFMWLAAIFGLFGVFSAKGAGQELINILQLVGYSYILKTVSGSASPVSTTPPAAPKM